jgi:hypothetical protein
VGEGGQAGNEDRQAAREQEMGEVALTFPLRHLHPQVGLEFTSPPILSDPCMPHEGGRGGGGSLSNAQVACLHSHNLSALEHE